MLARLRFQKPGRLLPQGLPDENGGMGAKMLNTFFFAAAIVVTFAGCAVLFVDVIATKKTDLCQEEIPAEYIGDGVETDRSSKPAFFVVAVPEFRYKFEGKSYQGRSANVFFHLFLRKGQLAAPFLDGKNYYIYVNPAQPSMYVTSGEQRFAFMHVLGCSVSVAGILMLSCSMGLFG